MAKRKEKADQSKAKHKVLRHVHHDGELYRKGSEVELTKDEASPLIAIGHVAAPVAEGVEEPAAAE